MERGRCQLLQQRWKEVVERYGNETALRLPGGRCLSFKDLDGLAMSAAEVPGSGGGAGGATADRLGKAGRVVVASGSEGVGFLVGVLRAWRDDAVFCPIEGAGTGARIEGFRGGSAAGSAVGAAVRADSDPEWHFPEGICHVKQTSGSTGVPRRVLFRAEQLIADAEQIVSTMGLRRDWPNVGVISMAHSYGFSNLVLPLLLHGIPLILAESALPESVREALSGGGGFTVPAVPAMWRAWHGAGVVDGKIRLAISAGAPLPLALEQAVFAETGVKLHNFYGSSECGGIAYDRTGVPRTDGRWAGTAMEGVALSVDADSGCLVVRSEAVAEGYAEEAVGGAAGPCGPGATAEEGTKRTKRTKGTTAPEPGRESERELESGRERGPEPHQTTLGDGVFLTTDEVILENGGVRLEGRATDAINVAGRKISPGRIEEVLCRLPGVKYCVAFGVPSADAARVEEIAVCVNLEDGQNLADVRRAGARELAAGEMPRHWRVCQDLRPDGRGKISRAVWRGRWNGLLRELGSGVLAAQNTKEHGE